MDQQIRRKKDLQMYYVICFFSESKGGIIYLLLLKEPK